jgi:5-methyltetrahydrofolate--homocysteine methyltransferase
MAAEGYKAIYINVDSAGTGESLLADAVNAAQGYIREPFLLESRSASMLEAALRIYKGRAGVIINTEYSEEKRKLAAVVSRYGSLVAENL